MFLIISLVWMIVSVFVVLFFVFINYISFIDVYFEIMFGFIIIGFMVFSGLDDMLFSILLWCFIL